MLRDIEQFINLAMSPFEGESIVSSETEGSERLRLIRNAVVKLKSVDAYLEEPAQAASAVAETVATESPRTMETQPAAPVASLSADNQVNMVEAARNLLSDSGIYPEISEVNNDQFALGA